MIQRLDEGSFFGETVRNRKLAGLTFRESRYTAGLKLPQHLHQCAYFCFVLRGSYDEVCGNRLRACRTATLTFHDQQEMHADRFHNQGAHLLSVELGPQWIENLHESSIILDGLRDLHGGASSYLAVRICNELRNDDAASAIALEGLTLELIATASRQRRQLAKTKPSRRIQLAKEYLDAHFPEQLRLAGLAVSVGAHPVYLAREFRRCYGCTVGEYIRQLRIEFACHQIATSEEPMVKIALNAGFSDQASFSKTFKRFTGKTPTEFRTTARLS